MNRSDWIWGCFLFLSIHFFYLVNSLLNESLSLFFSFIQLFSFLNTNYFIKNSLTSTRSLIHRIRFLGSIHVWVFCSRLIYIFLGCTTKGLGKCILLEPLTTHTCHTWIDLVCLTLRVIEWSTLRWLIRLLTFFVFLLTTTEICTTIHHNLKVQCATASNIVEHPFLINVLQT